MLSGASSPKKGLRKFLPQKSATAEQPARVLNLGELKAQKDHKGNYVSTTKYNVITYFPKALFEQYRYCCILTSVGLDVRACAALISEVCWGWMFQEGCKYLLHLGCSPVHHIVESCQARGLWCCITLFMFILRCRHLLLNGGIITEQPCWLLD